MFTFYVKKILTKIEKNPMTNDASQKTTLNVWTKMKIILPFHFYTPQLSFTLVELDSLIWYEDSQIHYESR
jgi:hypothetical protein